MKKKVVKLQETAPQEKSLLIGISSHENDYRLSWALNSNLSLKLAKSKNITIPGSKGNESRSFSCFRYYDEENMIQYMLIANTSEQGYLFPEYKTIDFVLKITGEYEIPESTDLLAQLKSIDIITLVFEISPAKIKNEKYLHWD